MAVVRWAALWLMVLGALLSPKLVDRDDPSLWEIREAIGQEAMTPAVTATVTEDVPVLPTPGEMPTETALADATATVTETTVVETMEPPATEPPDTVTPTPETSTSTPETETPTQTITVSPTTTPTVVVDPTLPELTDVPDVPGVEVSQVIGVNGGRVASPDGRVVIDFPAGYSTEPLLIAVRRQAKADHRRPTPDNEFVALWSFDATSPEGSSVHQFGRDLTFTLRFTAHEFLGLDPDTLKYWTYDENTGHWSVIPSVVDGNRLTMVATANHFSVDGATASRIVDLAPLLDGKLTDLHTGSSSLQIPITVPSGRGGLVPELTLNYDSGRMAEMRQYTDVSSWVGQGWDLGVGSIGFSEVASYKGSALQTTITRPFLELNGIGGELLNDAGDSRLDGTWRTLNEQYARITHGCATIEGCAWLVTDKEGRIYTFGGGAGFLRYYCGPSTATCNKVYYRADLASVEDRLGNRIEYTYYQQTNKVRTANGYAVDYIVSAYPSKVSYNGGLAEIVFNLAYDVTQNYGGWPDAQTIQLRNDLPQKKTDPCDQYATFYPPKVIETHRLQSIDVNIRDTANGTPRRVRKYALDYATTNFTWAHANCSDEWEPTAGDHKLLSISLRDRTDTTSLYTSTFSYADKHFGFMDGGAEQSAFDLPHLTQVDNGFGGSVIFEYSLLPKDGGGVERWTRPVVEKERHLPGALQPEVVRTFTYGPGPDADYGDPRTHDEPDPDKFDWAYRGFKTVTETDAFGNKTVHEFYTAGTWTERILTGKEHTTTYKDARDHIIRKATTDWQIRSVAGQETLATMCYIGAAAMFCGVYDSTHYHVNFVYRFATEEETRNADGTFTTKRVENTYDAYGNLEQSLDLGDKNAAGDNARSNTPYLQNTTDWIFVPKYSEKVDPESTPVDQLLQRTNFYYDGAISTTSSPTKGLRTAVSTQVGASSYSATYTKYDQWGNKLQDSVPTATAPESLGSAFSCATNASCGGVPAGVPYSVTTFDTVYRTFPLTVTSATSTANPTSLTTTYDYSDATHGNYTFGRPTRITEPSGHYTQYAFDTYGRTTSVWDNLDSSTYPSATFLYVWGTVPNKTVVQERVKHGMSPVRNNVTCMDGFGREVETRNNYVSNQMASVRTDYDSAGQVVAKSNATHVGTTSTSCPAGGSLAGTYGRDRQAYEYDALGQLAVTRYLQAGRSSGPQSTVVNDARHTYRIDEKSNLTTDAVNFGARTVTTTEPSSAAALQQIAPTGQGAAEWSVVNAPQHYDAVDENSPNDTDYVWVNGANKKESFSFAAPSVPSGAVVTSVTLKFRWKHYSTGVPTPTDGLWGTMTSGATTVRSTQTFRRSNADDWGVESWIMTLNPATGLPWQASDVAAGFVLGFETQSVNVSPNVSQVWIEVMTQTPGAASVVTRDKLGSITKLTDAGGNEATTAYDLGGRKTSMSDPNMGTWTYTYNPAGSLLTQTDARGIVTTMTYDALERVKTKSYSSLGSAVSYEYDAYPNMGFCYGHNAATALGQLVRMNDSSGDEMYCYDIRARSTFIGRTEGSGSTRRTITRTYDALDQVATLTYPTGEVVQYDSTAYGDITGITSTSYGTTMVSNAQRTPWGAPSMMTLGSAGNRTFGYDFRKRLRSITTGSNQNVTLTFDDASNVTAVVDSVAGETSNYSYDHLHRFTNMQISGSSVAAAAYDQLGNLTTKVEGASTISMTYPTSGPSVVRPHAVQTTTGSYNATFTYDANGNVLTQSNITYTYDANNHISSRSDGTNVYYYVYDGNGQLLKYGSWTGTSTVYIGGVWENTNANIETKYYGILGEKVAMRTSAVPGMPGTLYYLLRDHLGGTTAVSSSTGTIASTTKYYPFGAIRAGVITQTDQLFTGQRREQGDPLDLYNYGERMYSTLLGRFIQVDPELSLAQPQTWNPYAYVTNNPLRYTDPTGRRTLDEVEASQEAAKLQQALVALYEHQKSEAEAEAWTNAPNLACAFCDALVSLANAGYYSEASVANAWASSAPAPNPSAYTPDMNADDGGGGGLWGAIRGAADQTLQTAKDVGKGCWENTTCSGTGLVLVGTAVSFTPAAPVGNAMVVAGTGRLLMEDAPACAGLSASGCVNTVLDVATIGASTRAMITAAPLAVQGTSGVMPKLMNRRYLAATSEAVRRNAPEMTYGFFQSNTMTSAGALYNEVR